MASRRDQKDARREERTQGAEGTMRRTTQSLVAAARRAGHSPSRIREDMLRGLKDVLGLATFDSRAIVFDGHTQGFIDYAKAFQVVCDQERIEVLDPRVRQWWLSVVEDELERALKRAS